MRNRERNRTKRRAKGEVIERKPGSRQPFKRVNLIAAAVRATAAQLEVTIMGTPARVEATEAHGEAIRMAQSYRSRGHGGKHLVKNMQAGSRQMQDRSKYDPGNEVRLHAKGERRREKAQPIRFLPRHVQQQVSA